MSCKQVVVEEAACYACVHSVFISLMLLGLWLELGLSGERRIMGDTAVREGDDVSLECVSGGGHWEAEEVGRYKSD